jgi:hypothetical protein
MLKSWFLDSQRCRLYPLVIPDDHVRLVDTAIIMILHPVGYLSLSNHWVYMLNSLNKGGFSTKEYPIGDGAAPVLTSNSEAYRQSEVLIMKLVK